MVKPVRRALLYVCGLGQYELWLNGRRVGKRVLDPGWTNYRKTCLYSAYDVSEQLKPGRNAVGVMLGNGMYNVAGGRYVKFLGSFGPPKLILQLEIEHADGAASVVATDASWRTAPGPIVFSCIYGGRGLRRPAGDARLGLPRLRRQRVVGGPGRGRSRRGTAAAAGHAACGDRGVSAAPHHAAAAGRVRLRPRPELLRLAEAVRARPGRAQR